MSIQSSITSGLSAAGALGRLIGSAQPTAAQPAAAQPAAAQLSLKQKRDKAAQSAAESLQLRQDERRQSRRSFIEYMRDEPTSLGRKFGELSPELQKKIAATYPKGVRKKIMDDKDGRRDK